MSGQNLSDTKAEVAWVSEARRPSGLEWEDQRPYIEQFYRTHTLQELTEHMAKERGFKATGKMYRSKFQQWGIRKNNNAREMNAIARSLHDSEHSRETAATRCRSRSADVKELERYLKRKHLTVDQFIEQQTSSTRRLGIFPQAPRHVRAPANLEVFERLLYNVERCVRGSLGSRRWALVEEETIYPDSPKEIYGSQVLDLANLVFAALSVSVTSVARATRIWAYVSEEISSVVQKQNLLTYTRLCVLTQHLALDGKLGIAHSILRQVYNLTVAQNRPVHSPLLHLYKDLLLVQASDLNDSILALQLKVSDSLESILGDMHMESLNQKALLCVHYTDKHTNLRWSKELLKNLFARNIPINGRFMLVLLQHLQTLLNHREYARLIEDINFCYRHLRRDAHKLYFQPWFYMCASIAICHDVLNEDELAEKAYRETLGLGRQFLDIDVSAVAYWSRVVEANLKVHKARFGTSEISELRCEAEDVIVKRLVEKGHYSRFQNPTAFGPKLSTISLQLLCPEQAN